jgi:hypothetical protein
LEVKPDRCKQDVQARVAQFPKSPKFTPKHSEQVSLQVALLFREEIAEKLSRVSKTPVQPKPKLGSIQKSRQKSEPPLAAARLRAIGSKVY